MQAKILLIVLALAGFGCEYKSARVIQIDGTVNEYKRMSFGVESSTEDVKLKKDGKGFELMVGKSGSKTDLELAIEAYGLGFQSGLGRDD